jgi:RND superfamily putative drug exporter
VWTVAVATLVPLALIGIGVEPNYKATGELALRSDSLQGMAAIQKHFTPGEVGPITVLLVSPTDWAGRQGRLEIDHLTRGFASLDNVAEVRSLTQPLGSPVWDLTPKEGGEGLLHRLLVHLQPQIKNLQDHLSKATQAFYVGKLKNQSEYVTRLDVVLRSDPFEPESHATLIQIQNWLEHERPKTPIVDSHVRAECFGVTPNAEDLATVTESDRQRINGLVIASIFLVLFALVRKVWLAAYLLVTVLLSYFAALGATLLAASLWTGQPLTTLDWRVPFFLFTILVAVGEDYNIMLIARAFQEAKKFGNVEGMRRALAKTGGAITSCGLIMAGTFATLMLAGLGTLLQVGFALAFGVLVDTFIVRPFLVPAFALMVWKFFPPRVQQEEIPEIDSQDLVYVEAA